MIHLRRIPALVAGLAAAVAAVSAVTPPLAVRADTAAPPVVTHITPTTIVENGQPIRITLTGTGMSGVSLVFLEPVVAERSYAAFNDTTLLVTLPADLPEADYSITLQSAGGTSDPTAAEFSVRRVPVVSGGNNGPVTLPQYSFAPYPDGVVAPATGTTGGRPVAAPPAATPAVTSASASPTTNPLLIIAVGIVAGGLLYLLWGRPGRAEMARRRGFLAQLVTRPMQRLHLGRICLRCGRLHWAFTTRRDLWKAGRFCSATCFVASQEEDITESGSHSVAGSRLREMGIYAELETHLEIVFAGEAAAVGRAVNLFSGEGSWTVDDVEVTAGDTDTDTDTDTDEDGEPGAAEAPDIEPAGDQTASILEARTLIEAAQLIESIDRRSRRAAMQDTERAITA